MRIPAFVPAVLLAAALAAGGCKRDKPAEAPAATPDKAAAPAPEQRITGPVAKVNGEAIDAKDFYAEVDKITLGGARNIPEDRQKKIRDNVLDRLIEDALLRQEVKRQAIEVPAADVEAEYAKYRARFKTEDQFQNYLTHGKTSVEQIKVHLKDSMAVTKLLGKMGKLDVTPQDVQKAYESGLKMYTEPEQVHAVHVLVKVAENAPAADVDAASKRIAEVLKKAQKGEDFAALAKQYSEDAMTKEKGGDLGFFRKGVMVPKFEEAAFAMKVGEVSKEPVRSPFGFHVIKVLEHKAERVKPLDEVKDQILESLKNRNQFKARRELVESLKTTAKIERML